MLARCMAGCGIAFREAFRKSIRIRVALGLPRLCNEKLDCGRSVGETACFPGGKIPMHGRCQVSLKWFFGFTLLVAALLRWSPTIWGTPPIQLRAVMMGRMTSGNDESYDPLTHYELEHALSGKGKDGSILDQIKSLKSVDISLDETVIEPPRKVPLFDSEMELRRYFYICDAACILKDGTQRRLKMRIENNHFHRLD
jgi:hypothetical protein